MSPRHAGGRSPRPDVRRTLLDGGLAVARTAAVAALAAVGGLSVWAVAPVALGWQSHVIVSGSMSPAVEPGDLVLSAPAEVQDLAVGRVVLFTDPAGSGRTIAHRIREVHDGSVITRGDANAVDDSTPVPIDSVIGLGRLRIPVLGLPVVWLRDGRLLPLGLTAAGAVAAVLLAATGPDEGGERDARGRRGRRRAPRPTPREHPQHAGTTTLA